MKKDKVQEIKENVEKLSELNLRFGGCVGLLNIFRKSATTSAKLKQRMV